MMKLGILGAGMIVREFLPWLTGPESPFKVEALLQHGAERRCKDRPSATSMVCRATPPATTNC